MKEVIVVKNLRKVFKTKLKDPGLKGTLKSFFKPHYKEISAVNNISFTVKEGELIAFIGPNGAGKSTTLKMLSGILFSDSGSIRVLGINPTEERKKLAYKIGTVFGQKPQLWFHLPPIDSFQLFAKIYDLDQKEYEKRFADLVKRFELEEIMHQPVRKLSLGQRMRCEFALALLHNPKVLFLDEPTIGMDIIVKKSVRELIKKINEEEKITIILTSHDMDDVETLCKRAIIINHGTLVYDGSIEKLKSAYIHKKLIEVVSESALVLPKKEGIVVLKKTKFSASLEIDLRKNDLKETINLLLNKNAIIDITIEEPPVEEIIERIYRGD